MTRLLGHLWADRRGVAAVEIALIAPVLGVVALLSFEAWQAAGRSADMRTALKAGAQYYMNGGADDTAAQSFALSAWREKPAGAQISVARACACGEVVNPCTTLCSNAAPPAALITLRATAVNPTAVFNKTLAAERVVRVR